MKKVEDLIEKANELFEQAEMVGENSLENAHNLFLRGITYLLQAFLTSNAVESLGSLNELFNECKLVKPEFEAIEEQLASLVDTDLATTNLEAIIDSANEIWDFIIDLVAADDYY